ncbi:hypothetical protein AC578_6523 [Pseudocercospora eumusae]|uniref:Uncharacterized protein n=1 Tax=Pseudocercospora eumusae TaxID=321146 RepID=A0A139HI16_9PEZI|nr:hypothetical protein AC578_6523 [Pseudocercospora eumusae]
MEEREEVDTPRLAASQPVPHIVDRDWVVIGIGGMRHVGQVVQYRAIWADTRLPLPILRESQTGTLQVDVDGELCDIDSLEAVPQENADVLQLVRWQPKWMYMWELADARDLVVEFNSRQGRLPLKNRLGLSRYHSPEREVEGSARCELPDDPLLMPEDDADYTLSLMKVLLSRLETGEGNARLPKSRIISYLNQFPRQRLKMRSQWLTREGETKEVIHACSADKLRAMIVYVLGQSRRRPCSFCAMGFGPLPKCVTKGGLFAGTCANCRVMEEGKDCEQHHDNEWEHEDELPRWEDLPAPASAGLHEHHDSDEGRPNATSRPEASRRSQETALPTPPDSSLPSGPADCENESAANDTDQPADTELVDNVLDHINTMTAQGFSTGASANVTESDKHKVDYCCNSSDDDSDSDASSAQSHQQHLVPNSNQSANKRKSEDPSQVTPPDADIEGHETNSRSSKRRRTLPYTHDCCTQGLPCEHPLYRMSPGNRKPRARVFRHERFSRDDLASDNQVRFITRWSDCAFAEQCYNAWEALRSRQLREEEETGEVPFFESKEHLIAYAFFDELNDIVAARCPTHPDFQANLAVVDLTGDSD